MQRGAFDRAVLALWAVTTASMAVAIYLVFVYSPEERVMGAAQKIFYFHVPIAMVTFLSVFVLLAGSVGYLWTRRLGWDHLSRAATETGLLFCSLVLLTGPIWARPAWGVWWTWEARLTTTLLLWLLLVAGLMVRGYADSRELGARLAAIIGIVAAVDVPIIYKAVDWWRGQHPVLFKPGAKQPLAPEMATTFFFCIAVFLLLFVLLLAVRFRLAALEERTTRVVERATAA
ncbi:MAG TPA: cytochrome c biogenesis protein [Candidatus Polarisedimenticolaceae bacterium]|nr:cytochrome c biogenesis protein [Candidatus Polarisedimenticolaceae bacterium]